MSENPFIARANARKAQQRKTAQGHVDALAAIVKRFGTEGGEPDTYDRMQRRLKEAQDALEAIG